MKLRIPIGIVSARVCVSAVTNSSSSHANRNAYTNVATSPGSAFGSTTRTNAPNGVQPSTIAASSSSRGSARKNERMK